MKTEIGTSSATINQSLEGLRLAQFGSSYWLRIFLAFGFGFVLVQLNYLKPLSISLVDAFDTQYFIVGQLTAKLAIF